MNKERDYYFDNFKAFLIVVVVIGHYLGPIAKQYDVIFCIRKIIFLFHMPAFVFISGYFSKRNNWIKLVKTIFIPYVILQTIYFFFYNFIWNSPRGFSLLNPGYTLWFLLCLFVWRLMVDKLARIKGIIPILFVAGILAGFNKEIGKPLSLSRMIAFFPYFLLGYQFNKDKFMKWVNHKYSHLLAGSVLTTIIVWMAFNYTQIRFKLLESSYSYAAMHMKYGWMQRGILYIISTIMIFALAVLIPKKQHVYSYLGSRTMGIYMLHGLILKTIINCTNWYDYMNSPIKVVALVIVSMLICLILSTKIVDRVVRTFSSVPFEYMIKKDTIIP